LRTTDLFAGQVEQVSMARHVEQMEAVGRPLL